ncbi:MAG: Gfo/Idh/MocA family oxidoreductase [Kiritimatiellaeota bacterium]|nr:Gfo/Idh/MocA family oxidoreductase [Kiritimatiellota bacterium]
MHRRDFIKTAGLGAAALLVARGYAGAERPALRMGRILPSGQKLNIACIGCGGQGGQDVYGFGRENIVALCDVDTERAAGALKSHPNAKKYKDYRKMLKEMDEQIDAVTVSTPDHTHFPAAMLAIEMGKHVFVQKPLAHTVGEARELTLAARKHGVVTQMGNQGHAGEGTRLVREWVQAGVIGPVHEVHAWIGHHGKGAQKFMDERPAETPPVPETLDWNLWLGVAPERPYHPIYVPFNWRGWWDFGSCALGDMGCHVMDAAFWALDLKSPTSVEAETAGCHAETGPNWSIVTFQFPARGSLPPVKVVWYDGKKRPPRPKELEAERKFSEHGQLLVGEQGTIYEPGAYCQSPRLIPEAKMQALRSKLPPKTIPRMKGSHYEEWIRACKGGPKPGSNFDHSGPLTEMVLLGNIAIRTGKKIEWDGENLRCTNVPEANKYVKQPYRVF